jgi:hypothetical protein
VFATSGMLFGDDILLDARLLIADVWNASEAPAIVDLKDRRENDCENDHGHYIMRANRCTVYCTYQYSISTCMQLVEE